MSLNVIPEIALLTKEQTATMVKVARLKKPLTQRELADKAGISLRSLQRIENADVLPRNYTWYQLAAHVDLSMIQQTNALQSLDAMPQRPSVVRKWILCISSLVILCLSFCAYVMQSPTFPETQFEACLMVLAACVIYAAILYLVWK